MHPNAHCSTIYNRQDMEATWMSINREMGEEHVAHIYNVISLSHKKGWNCAACRDLDGLRAVIQNEESQKLKNKYCVLMHMCGL